MSYAAAVAAVAMAVSAYVSIQAGEDKAQAERANAKAFQQQAQEARDLASAKATQIGQRNARLLSAQRAQLGAAGAPLDSGSPLEVSIDSVRQDKLEQLNTTYQGELDANKFDYQAQIRKYYASQATVAGYRGAVSSLLSSASSYLGSTGGYSTAGT
jgi:hypothetical protein